MGAYGFSIEHILMVDIVPDPSVRKAMNEINAGIPLGYILLWLFKCSKSVWYDKQYWFTTTSSIRTGIVWIYGLI